MITYQAVIIFDTERHFNMLKNTIRTTIFVMSLLSSVVAVADVAKPNKVAETTKVDVYFDVTNMNQNKNAVMADNKVQVVEVVESDHASSQAVVTLLLVALIGFVGLSNRSSI
jgi:hypothetical protein